MMVPSLKGSPEVEIHLSRPKVHLQFLSNTPDIIHSVILKARSYKFMIPIWFLMWTIFARFLHYMSHLLSPFLYSFCCACYWRPGWSCYSAMHHEQGFGGSWTSVYIPNNLCTLAKNRWVKKLYTFVWLIWLLSSFFMISVIVSIWMLLIIQIILLP